MLEFSVAHTIVLIALSLASITLLAYYVLVFRRLANHTDNRSGLSKAPVSVVICARNESDNLELFLPKILTQDYPKYEVVVVDDASYDGTHEVLASLSETYAHLEIVTLTEEQKRTAGKKMALTLGFKRAKYDQFLLTDADCRPRSDQWIKSMCTSMDTDIVLGYSGYSRTRGFLNLFIRFDTWTSAVQYLSAALVGKAYMGVGRNLAYTRNLYHGHGGFRAHYHLISGDDDLMVNHASTRKNVGIRIQENSHTTSVPKETWAKWSDQKRRHMSVSMEYTRSSKWFLGIYHTAQLIFYLGIGLGIALGLDWRWLLSIFLLKTTIHLLISIPAGRVLKEKEMVVLLPLLEPLLLGVNVVIGLWSRISRPKAWK